jgi:hypothetical protein
VPDAGLLQSIFLPIFSLKGSIISDGKPSGYVGNALSKIIPAISQWPVVVSLPLDASAMMPKEAMGFFIFFIPSNLAIFPMPSISR